jgi:hypothetical protein
MTTRQLQVRPTVGAPSTPRRLTVALLQTASVMLGRLARRLHLAEREATGEPVLEFYAQAGAPEGALYVDGQLVATLPGVSRL